MRPKWAYFSGYNEIYIPIQTIYRPYRPYKPNNEIYIPTPNSTYITTDLIQTSQSNIHTIYKPTMKYTYLYKPIQTYPKSSFETIGGHYKPNNEIYIPYIPDTNLQ